LLSIKELPDSSEKIAIKKWESKLEVCYKIKAESYTYELANVAKWSEVTDSEQLSLVSEFSKGNLSYGQFASKRLEIDTRYRGQITRAVSSDYKHPENMRQEKDSVMPKTPSDSSSSCGWEGTQWVCRSL
jgi:DNA modification methylase